MMKQEFEKRLLPFLPQIVAEFGTPFHIYDEAGIVENGDKLKTLFSIVFSQFQKFDSGFQEFFAVKACPNPSILKIMYDLGFGFDCSSIPELILARQAGAGGNRIMFTSNNTSPEEFIEASRNGGCILNLDDISMINKVPQFPELICFRYNPGASREGNTIIGNPEEAKYGVRDDQIVDAYRLAIEKGAKRFGLHTMICSNQLDYKYMVETVKMILGVAERLYDELGISLEFVNIGGGIGIPYRPEQAEFDIKSFVRESEEIFKSYKTEPFKIPKLYIESGRYMTGPYGVLVTEVINTMDKYRRYVGVDACMSALMRPALYDAYHHITVLNAEGRETEIVDVIGSLCENNDKFAKQRLLPKAKLGDIMIIHDTGAHGHAMGFNYNGRLRPAELLLTRGGDVKLIRRAETVEDYFATFKFVPQELCFELGSNKVKK